jgi:hypothetical protein
LTVQTKNAHDHDDFFVDDELCRQVKLDGQDLELHVPEFENCCPTMDTGCLPVATKLCSCDSRNRQDTGW